MTGYETHEHDVLVIGAGGAGMRAAIEASAHGARTALVCKSLLGKAHTVMAEGGIAAALGNVVAEDDWRVHMQDTLSGGKYLNNWRMAELHAKEAPDRVRELERWGGVFDRTPEGLMSQRAFGGHTNKRLVHIGDRTGLELIRTLQDKVVHQGIDVFMECTVTRLLTDGDRVVGAFGYWRPTGDYVVFHAGAVVLATGGTGRCYPITSNSWEYTGDGQALAYAVGAELIDMEFVQFHPTGMVWPPGVAGLLVTEAVRGEGGILRNSEGERFMERYDPERMELSTRDIVSKAIYTEVHECRGSPRGGVFLDVSHLPADVLAKKLPSMIHQFKELAGVDITKEPMEVGPTCHYIMGGIAVDAESGASAVPGLFAAGECSGGLSGATRLGGNSLSDLLVFGRRAGERAAEHAREHGPTHLDGEQARDAAAEMDGYFGEGENPYALHADLQQVMQRNVGIYRDAAGLRTAIAALEEFARRARDVRVPPGERRYNPGWHLCRDLQNMIVCARAIANAALLREETRGSHSRLDFPEPSEEWSRWNIAVSRDGDGMSVERRPAVVLDEFVPLVAARRSKEGY